MLSFGSLFAGVGGADLGLEAAGLTCLWQVENDAACSQVLEYRWPDVDRYGDICTLNGADLEPVDVIFYGFPCQDLSRAGKRAGLDGEESHLFFEAVRIITEMQEATNGEYPKWAIAENVPGLLTADKGSAMARVLDTLAEAGALVIEWCVLDAQFLGVPQRRSRVFLAALFDSALSERCPDEIFPLADSGSGNPQEVDSARQASPRPFGESTEASRLGDEFSEPFVKSRRARSNTDHESWIENAPAPTLNSFENTNSRATTAIVFTAQRVGEPPRIYEDVAPSLLQRMGTGGNQTPLVAHSTLRVRRLTPLECERLQGWPDDHTRYRADGKEQKDTPRYKQIGNGVASPAAEWIARQILAVHGGSADD